ncbi:hypothetical protein [Chitinophaga rupis]|nr:hypothetical protein [Chitinophaga rupis]
MKTLQTPFKFNRMQNPFQRPVLAALLMCSLLITLYGCGKPTDTPTPPPVNTAGCVITGDVDQAVGSRVFEYDDKGYLIKMTAPNYYYGPFVETITPTKVVDTYPTQSVSGDGTHISGIINTTYKYTGGSGNIYDGNPQFMHQLFTASNPPYESKTDSMFQFLYDDAKKHLTSVLMPGDGSPHDVGFTLFRFELNFTYDANDNVTQVKIVYDYLRKVYVPQTDQTRIDYLKVSDQLLNITYDDKPSAYTAISKYWKFIGGDFYGFTAYNLDKLRFWAGRCAILSKNNPVKITGKLRESAGPALVDINADLTYQYNEKNYPVSMAINGTGVQAFTYNCK